MNRRAGAQGKETVIPRSTRDTSKRRQPRGRVEGSKAQKRASRLTPGVYALLAMGFLGAGLLLYEPAMTGPFLSDDLHYVENNAYVHTLSSRNLLTILDPFGQSTLAVVNYSPVQLLIHAVAWSVFGSETTGHHVVNVLFHVLASLLLIPLFIRSGVHPIGAIFGGVVFLVHPANVEAVAWISQLKSSSALTLSLAALLVFPKRRALGTVLFVLALLAKPTAAFALPVAALLSWTQDEQISWRWLAVWLLAFLVFSFVELSVHQRSGAAAGPLYATPFALVMTIGALAARYLLMASTSLGVSAFHEPRPIESFFDPWWLGSLPALALLGWRLIATWRGRQPEVAFWVWALVSFAPVSQIFPFLYPLADRYLYFILPGLLGGALLAGQGAALYFWPDSDTRRRVAWVGIALGVALCGAFAAHAHSRARIWRFSATLAADAARHYPDGVSASLIRARNAAQSGDAAVAAVALQAAVDRGFNQFAQIYGDPAYDPVRNDPRFRAIVDGMAAGWIQKVAGRKDPTQGELRMAALAHIARREYDAARQMLTRALELGDAYDEEIRADLDRLARMPH